MDNRSRLFGNDRWFDLDSIEGWEEINFKPFWPSKSRPDPDQLGDLVRLVIETKLKASHKEAIESFWFEGKSIGEIARERHVTKRAARSMLQRAQESFKKELTAYVREQTGQEDGT